VDSNVAVGQNLDEFSFVGDEHITGLAIPY